KPSKKFGSRLAVVHRGPSDEAESGERDHLTYTRPTAFINKKLRASVAIVHKRRYRGYNVQTLALNRSDQPIVVTPSVADDLRPHQQQPDCRAGIEGASPLAFVPFHVEFEGFKELWRVRMIDSSDGHRFR